MPEYIYRCKNGHEAIVCHGMNDKLFLECFICDMPMRKRPLAPAVNWGGMKPSKGDLHPNMKRLIDEAPKRRDEEKR